MIKNVLIVLLLVILAFVAGSFIMKPGRVLPWGAEKQKEYANVLVDRGIYAKAIEEYNKLIDSGLLSKKESANLAYIVGNIYLENLHDYENALSSYLRVEIFNKGTELKDEVNQKIIECLERTGRSFEARKEMDRETLLKKEPEVSKGTVVARIGKRVITIEELQEQIKNLPSYIQANYKDKDKQFEFLKNYIATELLYNAAKRRNYDKDGKINKQIDDMKKALVVQKLIEDETKDKINVSNNEIELYYQAHKKDFVEKKDKKERQKALDEVKQNIQETLAGEKMKQAEQELLGKLFKAEEVAVYEDVFKGTK